MPAHHRPYTSCFEPYGYECLVVDEDVLSDADRRDAILSIVDQPRDAMGYLTRDEQNSLARALNEIEDAVPPHCMNIGGDTAKLEKRAEFARLGTYRAHARHKYAGGRRIWYGDRPPWQQSDSANGR